MVIWGTRGSGPRAAPNPTPIYLLGRYGGNYASGVKKFFRLVQGPIGRDGMNSCGETGIWGQEAGPTFPTPIPSGVFLSQVNDC